jgi:6-phosphogluconolactonase (cycloisomerase 2 family)
VLAAAALGGTAVSGMGEASVPNPSAYFAYVGSRTRNARGEGISVYRVDAKSGRWSPVQVLKGLTNPSYLALDRTNRFLYSVHGDMTDITAFAIDARSGKLSLINQHTTDGTNPVHVTVDSSNRYLIVANHLSSTIVVLARNEDGSIGEITDKALLTGALGPHRVEQQLSKPHQAEFDRSGRYLVVPDKGLDRVFTFRFDSAGGKLAPIEANAPQAREGAGPRHVAFHPGNAFAYVVNELDSTITAYHFDSRSGSLSPFQIVPAVPDSYVSTGRAAEITISPEGDFVYASNRGHDSLAIFSVERESGRLTSRGWESTRGRTPRFFTLDPQGRFAFVANQDGDSIVTFARNPTTGALSAVNDVVKTGSPVCIVLAPEVT